MSVDIQVITAAADILSAEYDVWRGDVKCSTSIILETQLCVADG